MVRTTAISADALFGQFGPTFNDLICSLVLLCLTRSNEKKASAETDGSQHAAAENHPTQPALFDLLFLPNDRFKSIC